MNILIVDDDVDFAESLEEMLLPFSYNVTLAFSGQQAIDLYKQQNFDIVLLDVKMPGLDGLQTLLQLQEVRANVNVVMMSAFSMHNLLDQALKHGAKGVLNKPLNLDALFGLLHTIAAKQVVLVVDDDVDFADSLAELLRSKGFTVQVTHTGEQALESLRKHKYHALILDIRLPNLNGLQVYESLRMDGLQIPTFVVTAYSREEKETIKAFDSLSVSNIYQKPFDSAVLVDEIKQLVDQSS